MSVAEALLGGTRPPLTGRYASVLVISPGGQFVLTTRHYTKKFNQPRFPGGKIEQGESPILAARRELEEELNIVPERLHFLATFDHAADSGRWFGYHFVCIKYRGIPKIQEPHKHDQLAWLNADELQAANSYPEYEAFRLFKEMRSDVLYTRWVE